MKKHAIIPIFIPHLGCRHLCVFCNQNNIAARQHAATEDEVISTIEAYLSGLSHISPAEIEIAFYGGSFTGIPLSMQNNYLEIAERYVKSGQVSSIHLSTRPDYIDEEILANLKAHNVKTIELGVQSFDESVLKKSKRGHDAAAVIRASEMIKSFGFDLGIQLMVGLPGDSFKSCIYSAKETAKLAPKLARLYPVVVIDDTELFDMYKSDTYEPLSRDEAIARTKEMYMILYNAGIKIMRVGLKSTDLIGSGELSVINGGTYHPAFRQLVEGEIAYDKIASELRRLPQSPSKLDISSNPEWFSNMIGNCSINKNRFAGEFPMFNIRYLVDHTLGNMEFSVKVK